MSFKNSEIYTTPLPLQLSPQSTESGLSVTLVSTVTTSKSNKVIHTQHRAMLSILGEWGDPTGSG